MQKLLWAFIGLMFTSAVVAEDWRALPPAFQTEFRRLLPDVGFDLAKDKVTLRNRGGVLSVQETEDFSLSFTWRQKGGKDGDVLTVAYATDGNRSGSDRSFEVRMPVRSPSTDVMNPRKRKKIGISVSEVCRSNLNVIRTMQSRSRHQAVRSTLRSMEKRFSKAKSPWTSSQKKDTFSSTIENLTREWCKKLL
ncbi:MAG: hypothetical protein Greene041662_1053 [Candidatus Peregrinibacteria bacterium Greene0416_62]|nr:MAG: hypothetical protein Greene041662_1053 [Candidatus Peregrinibacteria bacterium Greene0416_62]